MLNFALKSLFPLMEDNKSLASLEGRAGIRGKASLLAALYYYISMHSDVFISASPWNMHNAMEEFEKRTQSIISKSKLKSEVRLKAEVESPAKWERWIKDQQKSEGVIPGEDVYIILRLDGRVRRSGRENHFPLTVIGIRDWRNEHDFDCIPSFL